MNAFRKTSPLLANWPLAALLAWVWLLPFVAAAQTAGSGAEQQPARVLRFYYVSYAGTDDAQAPARARFQLLNDGQVQSFSLGANTLSPVIDYRGAVPLALFEEVEGVEGPERIPLADLRFPASWDGVLFLVLHDPSAGRLAFRFIPIEYSAAALPQGSVRFISLVNKELAVMLGAERGSVNGGGQLQLQLSSTPAPLPFRVAERTQDDWKLHISSVIPPFVNTRGLVVFYPGSPDGQGLRVLTLSDLPSSL